MLVGLMCTLGPSTYKVTSHCELFAIIKKWNHILKRHFPFNTSCIKSYAHILRSFLPFSPCFNSSFILLAIWTLRNESICIERTGWRACLNRSIKNRGKYQKSEAFKQQEEQGFEQILKDDCAWAFSPVLQRKNVNPVSVRRRIINSQKHQNTAQQTQTKRRMGKARRINSSNISSDFRMRWWNTGCLCPQPQQSLLLCCFHCNCIKAIQVHKTI